MPFVMFLKFLTARHRSVYIKIARKYKTTPWHVYRIAHGEEVVYDNDRKIAHELMDMKIIHRHSHSSADGDD